MSDKSDKKNKAEKTAFQKRLIELRKNKGLTQEQLAEKLNISRDSVNSWENAKKERLPAIDKLKLLAKYFDVSVDYLLGRSDYTQIGNKEISEMTGLSDKAINKLRLVCRSDQTITESNKRNLERIENDSSSVSPVLLKERMSFLNFLLESKRFINLLNDLIYFFDSDRYTTLLDDSFHQIKNSHGLINKSFYPADNDLIAGGSEIRIDEDTHKAISKNLLDIHLMNLSEEYKKKK